MTDNISSWPSQMNATVFAVTDNSTATVAAGTPVRWGAAALGLIVLATAFGNILLCVAVFTDTELRNMINYFLASLAVSDLLVAVVVMPLAVVIQIYGMPFCQQSRIMAV